MTKIIPRGLIQHLEWVPGSTLIKAETQEPKREPARLNEKFSPQKWMSVDALIKDGKAFYSEEKNSDGKYIGVAVALQEALDYVGSEGIVASMPYLLAGKLEATKKNYLWKDWYTALTEEDIGIDEKGTFVKKGNPVLITLHGGGILTPNRIKQAIADGLTPQNAATFTDDEFKTLIEEGKLPTGEDINLYTLETVRNGTLPDPYGRYAIVQDFSVAKATLSDYHEKEAFVNNPVALARAGSTSNLEKYFEKAKSGGTVGNWHRFSEIDSKQPQGRVLFLYNDIGGLIGSVNLIYNGRFVGVAPEAHRAKK